MANPLQSFRTKRPPTSIKGFSAKPDELPAAPAAAEELLKAYDYLASKNPAFGELVEKMDLMEVGAPQLVPSPAKAHPRPTPAPSSPAQRKVLQRIADQAFEASHSYELADALARIMQTSGVPQERAAAGLDLMLTESIVSLTPAGTYYLTGVVPF